MDSIFKDRGRKHFWEETPEDGLFADILSGILHAVNESEERAEGGGICGKHGRC